MYDAAINGTDLINIVDNFIFSCNVDKNTHEFIAKFAYYIDRVLLPFYLGVGAITNLMVIIFLLQMYKKKISKMSSYHFLIINLATADFLVCAFIPVTLREYSTITRFECLFFFEMARRVCPIASCWLLTLIAFTRYRIIVQPFHRKLNKKTCCIFVSIIWIMSFIASSYGFVVMRYSNTTGCYSERPRKERCIYNASLSVFYFIIPSALMWYFFHQIEKKLDEHKTDRNLVLNKLTPKRNRKALKTLRFLLIVFVVTAAPGQIILLLTFDQQVKIRLLAINFSTIARPSILC